MTDLNAMEEYELSRSFAIDVYILCQWLRRICRWRLLNDNDLKLGGMGPLDSSMIPRSMNLVLPINQR